VLGFRFRVGVPTRCLKVAFNTRSGLGRWSSRVRRSGAVAPLICPLRPAVRRMICFAILWWPIVFVYLRGARGVSRAPRPP
jgi:hypothetical protein